MATRPMTDFEKKFVAMYCGPAHMDKAKAARMSGAPRGSAATRGWRTYKRPHVRRSIDRRMARMAMSAEEVTRRLSDMAAGSIKPFVALDADGTPRIDLGTRKANENMHLIKKLKVTRKTIPSRDGPEVLETKVDIELHDAKDATIQLGRIYGLYIERDKNGEVIPNFKVYVGIDPDAAL